MACGHTISNVGLRLAAGLVAWTLALAAPSLAAPIKTNVAVTVNDGYARLVFTADEYIDASARVAGSVLIISFKQPISVSVDRVAQSAPDFIGAARTDPDGMAVRMALSQNVTVNAMAAGEKLYVDLLPASWTGVPPGLPQDVVDDLARRARQAELLLQHQRQAAQDKKLAPIRIHVATQPTFTRFVFDVPNQTGVTANRAKDRLILNFDAPLTFDLADAQAAMPAGVQEISSELDTDSSLVRFLLDAKVDLRTFRDDNGYVVDVVKPDGNPDQASQVPAVVPANSEQQGAAPATMPATVPATVPATAAGDHADTAPANPGAANAAAPATIPAQGPQSQAAPVTAPAAAAAAAVPVAPAPQADAVRPPQAAAQPGAQSSPAPAAQIAAPPITPTSAPAPQASAAPPQPAIQPNPPADAAKPADTKPADASGNVAVELVHRGANLKLTFPFKALAPAAVFHRADMLWLVFDSKAGIDLSALDGEGSRTIRGYDFTQTDGADIVRLKLDRPHLSSVAGDGAVWTVEIGDSVLEPSHALDITRNLIGPNRSSVTVDFDAPQKLHRLTDPEAGDMLDVVTGLPPARGFIDAQDFIEFRALASTQGIVIEPLADDLNVELAPDKIVVGRPTGLTLSTSLQTLLKGKGLRPVMFDAQIWGFDRQVSYGERQSHLLAAAAAAPETQRLLPRLDLARFYLARDMYPEAKGVLDVALASDRPGAEVVSAVVLRAVAEVMMNRPDDALKDLATPAVGDQHDAPLWRALAYAREGKWTEARAGFKTVEASVATLPVELQRVALKDEMRSAIEVGDFNGASTDLNDFETIGVPHDMEPVIAILMGRLAEGMGRTEDALSAYRTAADSWDRPAAAQGLLRETALRYQIGDLKRDDVINQLETLTTIWRGDETEIEALKLLAHLYTEDGRYRDAFYVMRSAMASHPDSEMTRQIQDEAAATFDSLFLAGKGDAMPAIDALALFYDFRELTPIGSRGDEMIRRLADRLVSVDLLDQAADLLQYQVDHRLQGAGRAQIATRLAVIYLMNRKADRALATLRATRTADLSDELRNQRLLLEGRALSDLGRRDLAIEVIANVDGPEAIRLRSDILWAARKWDESAAQIELMYGDRYKDFTPLTEVERQDILRAEIGYALGEDTLGLGRFRDKYAAKMASTPDARAFDIVSSPLGSSGAEFASIAHAAASVDTLEGFLRDMKARYSDAAVMSSAGDPAATPAAPMNAAPMSAVPAHPGSNDAPAAPAQPPETVPPAPPARASGHTAMR
jgi:tetratricopeptide (TPR) repeat protein